MRMLRRNLVGGVTAGLLPLGLPRRVRAQPAAPIRIGLLTDMSGPYADDSGPMSVLCARQAAAEFSASTGIAVEVLAGDHQLKPDVGAAITRHWFDQEGVDAVADMTGSAVALAAATVAREKNKVALASGAATIDLMKGQCSPNVVMFWNDTYEMGTVIPKAITRQGDKTWFCIGSDYVGSQQIMKDTVATVEANGGKVLGTVTHAFPGGGDFSSYLLQAQASGAQILGLCNTSADLVNTIKQANEFQITKSMRLAVQLMFISNVRALGLDIAQKILVSEPFYWDLNERTRAFTARLKQRSPGQYHANSLQAAAYSATWHYLKAVQSLGSAAAKADGAATVARMKAMPTDDDCYGAGHIREDGRKIQPGYVFEIKTPAESTGDWDVYKLQATVTGDEAVFPANAACPLTHR